MNLSLNKTAKMVAPSAMMMLLVGCSGSSGISSLFEPGPVHVEARQEKLEGDVDSVGEQYRVLKDRFDALERLYVDLARNTREQQDRLGHIEANIGALTGTAASQAALTRLASEIADLQETLKGIDTRLFSIELNGPALAPQRSDSISPDGEQADATEAGGSETPVETEADPDRVQYGVHLGSYRSMDQVPGSWNGLSNAFADELAGLQPRTYSQSLQGIGDLVRLIAGPVETQSDAESICEAIKLRGREQYCEATEYQGDPLQ